MKRHLLRLLPLLALAACGGGQEAEPEASGLGERKTALAASTVSRAPTLGAEIVVMLAKGQDVAAIASSYGARVIGQFGQRPIYRLRLASEAEATVALPRMQADARLRFAERNQATDTPEGLMQVVWVFGGSAAAYRSQWAPTALALGQAHAITTGAGVRVAVIDSAFDLTHPVLAGKWARRADGSLLGRDLVDDDANPQETAAVTDTGWGHGTHVAGLVALAAPGARLMPVRALDNTGRGNTWVLAEALMWAVDPDGDPRTDDGARVVNISLGTAQTTRLLNTAVELATCSDDDENEPEDDYSDPGFDADKERCNQRHGVVVMAAAGNGGSAVETMFPAAEGAEGQLAITAFRRDKQLAGFANRGPWVQLAAPGDRVLSTVPGGRFATWSGTSMATPLASGVAALVLSLNPDWKPNDVSKRLAERSIKLCGGTPLRGLHALGAVADFVPPDPYCP